MNINKILNLKSQAYSYRELSKQFHIAITSIRNCDKKILPTDKRNKPDQKLDLNLLQEDVINHPDAYQYERAERFNVSEFCIWHELKKLSITYKKTLVHPKADEDKQMLLEL